MEEEEIPTTAKRCFELANAMCEHLLEEPEKSCQIMYALNEIAKSTRDGSLNTFLESLNAAVVKYLRKNGFQVEFIPNAGKWFVGWDMGKPRKKK